MWRTAEAHSRLSQGVGRGPHVASQTCQYGGSSQPGARTSRTADRSMPGRGWAGSVSMSAQSARELVVSKGKGIGQHADLRQGSQAPLRDGERGPKVPNPGEAFPLSSWNHASCFLLRTATRGSIARVLPDSRWRRMKCASAMELRSYRGERSPAAHSFTGGCSSR